MMIRAKYEKLKPVRYISHLELMDTLRRTFRRAELPAAYSEGFNPHIKLSMSQPLSVGMTGYGEYFDVELTEEVEIKLFIERLNLFLPDGIKIDEAREIPEGIKSLQAVINTAVYNIKMEYSSEVNECDIKDNFLKQKEIRVLRKRRNKKDRVIDLKPLIYNIDIIKPGYWGFTVSTGSQGNVRSGELVRALSERYEEVKIVPLINIERRELLVRMDGEFLQPFAGKVIGR